MSDEKTELTFAERYGLTEDDLRRSHEARKKRLEAMTETERKAFLEAEEADALREALTDDQTAPEFGDPPGDGATRTYNNWGKA